jgi:hypothetical protein
MTECNDGDVRDLLPDYVAGTLARARQDYVEAHVASCAECADEAALLRVVRSVRPRGVDIDVSRIVAALPGRPSAPALHLLRDDAQAATRRPVAGRASPGVIDIAARRRPASSAAWRIAAAVGITVVGSWSLLNVGRDGADTRGNRPVAVGSSTAGTSTDAGDFPRGETLASRTVAGDSGPGGSQRTAAPMAAGAGLSLGDLSEYSDEELQRVLDRLDKWDGATSTDPLTPLPIVSVSRGTL